MEYNEITRTILNKVARTKIPNTKNTSFTFVNERSISMWVVLSEAECHQEEQILVPHPMEGLNSLPTVRYSTVTQFFK